MGIGTIILNQVKTEKIKAVEDKVKDKFLFTQHKSDDCLVQVKFKDIDKYGIVVEYITVSRETPILDINILNEILENQADEVQKKITYLLEDFRLIEIDKMSKRAQLRSYPPHKKDNSKFYYEIVLDEGIRIHFQRYEFSSSHRRYEKITSQLTIETFERLVDDMHRITCQT